MLILSIKLVVHLFFSSERSNTGAIDLQKHSQSHSHVFVPGDGFLLFQFAAGN